MKTTDVETEIVCRASSMFKTYQAVLDDESKDPRVIFAEPIRVFQVLLYRHPNRKVPAPQVVYRIVENACLKLLEAIDADAREEMYDALGSILVDVCSICSGKELDFCEISRNFDSQFLNTSSGESIVGILNLFKAVGAMAIGFQVQGGSTEAIGVALIRVCSAVHWLAFANDMDASILFQATLQQKLTSLFNDL